MCEQHRTVCAPLCHCSTRTTLRIMTVTVLAEVRTGQGAGRRTITVVHIPHQSRRENYQRCAHPASKQEGGECPVMPHLAKAGGRRLSLLCTVLTEAGGRRLSLLCTSLFTHREGDCHCCAHPLFTHRRETVTVVHTSPHTQGGACHCCAHPLSPKVLRDIKDVIPSSLGS